MNKFIGFALNRTSLPLYVCSLPNPDNPDKTLNERNVHTRDPEQIEDFIKKYNVPGRAVYWCVGSFPSTAKRAKKNITETRFVHLDVDAKDISISVEEVKSILLASKKPPSLIASSGRGIHAYWVLKEPTKDLFKLEALLKDLARCYSGDPVVAHFAALMRLPGTINSKDGGHRETPILHESKKEYTLADLSDHYKLCDVAIGRGDNVLDFRVRPPVDVEGRLAAMSYRGQGETGIHSTQLSVTAAMLNAGTPVDDVVRDVLKATQNVVSENWDWAEEEKTIRGMCQSWVDKQNPAPVAQVVNIAQAKPAEKKKKSKEEFHLDIAVQVMEFIKKKREDLLLVDEDFFHYHGGVWRNLAEKTALSSYLDREISECCHAKGVLTSNRLKSEVRGIIRDLLIKRVDRIDWDNTPYIPFKNGLLDHNTGEVFAHAPNNFLTRIIDRDYVPTAKAPTWLRMLETTFAGKPEIVGMVQEIAGVGLLSKKSRSLTTAAVFVGPAASGKSSLLEVLGKIYSSGFVNTPIENIEKPHGTIAFLRQQPWVLDEAFSFGTWNASQTVKAILTGEKFSVNVKHGPEVSISFRAPIFWGANVAPQFREQTAAIKSRLSVINCCEVFDLENPTGLLLETREKGFTGPADYVINRELPGVIAWAVEGLIRATKRGVLAQVDEIKAANELVHEEGNYAIEFLRDCTKPSPGRMVSTKDLHGAFSTWWIEERGDRYRIPGQAGLVKSIKALHRKDMFLSPDKWNNHRYLLNVELSDAGRDLWSSASQESINKGSADRYSDSVEKTVVEVPEKWL